jgi:hypothetical protein
MKRVRLEPLPAVISQFVTRVPVFLVCPDPNDEAVFAVRHALVDHLNCSVTNPDVRYSEGEAVVMSQFGYERRIAKDREAINEAAYVLLPPLKMRPDSADWHWETSYLALEQVTHALAKNPPLEIKQLAWREPNHRLVAKTISQPRVQQMIDDNLEAAYAQYEGLPKDIQVKRGDQLSKRFYGTVRIESAKLNGRTVMAASARIQIGGDEVNGKTPGPGGKRTP